MLLLLACSEAWLIANSTLALGTKHITYDKVVRFAQQLHSRSYFIAKNDAWRHGACSQSKVRLCRLARRTSKSLGWRSFRPQILSCLLVSNFLTTWQFRCHYSKRTPGRSKISSRIGHYQHEAYEASFFKTPGVFLLLEPLQFGGTNGSVAKGLSRRNTFFSCGASQLIIRDVYLYAVP